MVAEAFVRLGRRDAARSWAEECAIKLVEACVSEDRLSPDPVYALAALDAASRLHPWRLPQWNRDGNCCRSAVP